MSSRLTWTGSVATARRAGGDHWFKIPVLAWNARWVVALFPRRRGRKGMQFRSKPPHLNGLGQNLIAPSKLHAVDALTIFGLFAATAMLVLYAL